MDNLLEQFENVENELAEFEEQLENSLFEIDYNNSIKIEILCKQIKEKGKKIKELLNNLM